VTVTLIPNKAVEVKMSQVVDKRLNEPVGVGQNYAVAAPWHQRKAIRQTIYYGVVYLLILTGAAFFILPFLGMLSTALKEPQQIFVFPPQWIPNPIRWQNFSEGWTKYLPFTTFLLNSLKISINAVIGNLISCALPAYAFARLRARGKNILFAAVLATMVLPTEVTIVPQYILFTKLGWNNTHWPLLVPPWLGWPFFIFLLRQFFMTLPKDLDDAARMDGASSWQILWHVMLPLSKPALATVAIFAFIGNWNNYLSPLIYLRDEELLTLAVGLNQFRGQFGNVQYHLMMAVAVLVLMPVLVIFFVGQRYFVQGIALTGMKG
jgi:ABC-type glycerol-3-phosphate transport system permease component